MARLTRRHKELVHKLLRERKTVVNLTAAWEQIYTHFEVGKVVAKQLRFTPQDRNELQALAHREWGFDPLQGVPDGSRVEVAAHSCDDKLATEHPDEHYVLIKSARTSLVSAGISSLPPGCSLRIQVDQLDFHAIDSVVIIENLDSFDLWQQYQMPENLQTTLTVYRGHDGLAKGVKSLLKCLLPHTSIVVFPDLDPAGLQIACTTPGVTHLLIPEQSPQLIRKNNKQDYHRQYRQIKYLEAAHLGGWQSTWNEMKKNQTSIKQQHMLAFATPLFALKLNLN